MRHALLTAVFLSLLASGPADAEPKKTHRWRNPSAMMDELSHGVVISGFLFGPLSVLSVPVFAVSAVVAVGDSVRVLVVDTYGFVVGEIEVPKERAQRAGLKPGDPVQIVADPAGHTITANGVMLGYVPGETTRDLVHRERYAPE